MKISSFDLQALFLSCLGALLALALPVPAESLSITDILKPPVNVSIKGTFYSGREKDFSVDISADRFIKVYSDGVTIIGVKNGGGPVYYLMDKNKKTVVKVSQSNLYRIGQFFDWNNMTTLVTLPAESSMIAKEEKAEGCTLYGVAKTDITLCVDGSYHIPVAITQKSATVARVTSVKPLDTDLKAAADSMILACLQDHYSFLDADDNLNPDSD